MASSGKAESIEKRLVVEYGTTLDGVWLPLAMLRRLGTRGPWDSPFTEATADQSGRPGDLTPGLPQTPYVSLSAHTAPTVQRKRDRSR